MAETALTRRHVAELAARLGIDNEESVQELERQIASIARWWSVLDEIPQVGARPSIQRTRLRAVGRTAGKLIKEIDGLDPATNDALTLGFRLSRRSADPRTAPLDRRAVLAAGLTRGVVRDLVDLLREATTAAAAAVPRGDGRPSNVPLQDAIFFLAQVYAEFSGRTFTRDNGGGVRGEASWTAGAQWVADIARAIAPYGKPPSCAELDTAMRYAATSLRKEGPVRVPWLDGADEPEFPWLDDDNRSQCDGLQEPGA